MTPFWARALFWAARAPRVPSVLPARALRVPYGLFTPRVPSVFPARADMRLRSTPKPKVENQGVPKRQKQHAPKVRGEAMRKIQRRALHIPTSQKHSAIRPWVQLQSPAMSGNWTPLALKARIATEQARTLDDAKPSLKFYKDIFLEVEVRFTLLIPFVSPINLFRF